MKEKSHFIDLFWDIYDLLLDFFRGERYSTQEIAARFDRSERTARRYLDIIKRRVHLEKDRDGRYYIPGSNRSVPCEILFTRERIEALKIAQEELRGTEIGDIIEEILADMGVQLEGFTSISLKDVNYDVLLTLNMACEDFVPVRIVLSNGREYVMHVHEIFMDENGDGFVIEGYAVENNGSHPFYLPVSHIIYAQLVEKGGKR